MSDVNDGAERLRMRTVVRRLRTSMLIQWITSVDKLVLAIKTWDFEQTTNVATTLQTIAEEEIDRRMPLEPLS